MMSFDLVSAAESCCGYAIRKLCYYESLNREIWSEFLGMPSLYYSEFYMNMYFDVKCCVKGSTSVNTKPLRRFGPCQFFLKKIVRLLFVSPAKQSDT